MPSWALQTKANFSITCVASCVVDTYPRAFLDVYTLQPSRVVTGLTHSEDIVSHEVDFAIILPLKRQRRSIVRVTKHRVIYCQQGPPAPSKRLCRQRPRAWLAKPGSEVQLELQHTASMDTIDANAAMAAATPEMLYRLLCHNDIIGSIIGKGGETINAMRLETGASIRVEDYVHGCEDRVITISTSAEESSDHASTSKGALKVVVEKLLEEAAKESGEEQGATVEQSATVRMLLWDAQAGCVIGKGGAVISELRTSTGAEIRVLAKLEVPMCASVVHDTVCQISGKPPVVLAAVDAIHELLRRNPMEELPPSTDHRSALPSMRLPSAAGEHAGRGSGHNVSFKMIVPSAKIGSVIGRGGEVIQKIREETNAKIQVSQPSGGEGELEEGGFRLVEFSSSGGYPPAVCSAQEALLRCFYCLNEEDIPRSSSAKLLVPRKDIGALLGKSGSVIQGIRKESGAYIKLVDDDDMPEFAAGHGMLTVEGSGAAVSEALRAITLKLQEAHISRGAPGSPAGGRRNRKAAAAAAQGSERIVMHISREHVGSIIGKGGSNITQIRQISGANVKLHDADPVSGEHELEITGSEQQCSIAGSVIQAFLGKAGSGKASEE